MPQDKKRRSDNPVHRKPRTSSVPIKSARGENYRRRRSQDCSSEIEFAENIYTLDIDKASENDRKVFSDLTEKGISHDDHAASKVNIGLKNERGKRMIVNPALEKKRMLLRKLDFICIAVMIVAVFAATAFASINIILDSDTADKAFFGKTNPHISDDGNYIFGEFDGYVTIGDTLETAFEILGLPDSHNVESNLYYYGYSYIIINNNIVVGYYKDKSEEFHVTVGYKNPGTSSANAIGIGDSATRVVKKLGSPDYYLKHRWIYEDMNEKFEKSSYSSGTNLVIIFDDNYNVSGYEFIN